MNQVNTSFEKLLDTVTGEVISKMLGAEVWRALTFYFDTKIATSDPEAFARVLERIFGASSKTIGHMVVKTLFTKLGIPPDKTEKKEFAEGISIAKARFPSHLTSLPSNP